MSRIFETPLNLPAFSADPTTPTPRAGDCYFNTTTNKARIYFNSAWNDLASTANDMLANILGAY